MGAHGGTCKHRTGVEWKKGAVVLGGFEQLLTGVWWIPFWSNPSSSYLAVIQLSP